MYKLHVIIIFFLNFGQEILQHNPFDIEKIFVVMQCSRRTPHVIITVRKNFVSCCRKRPYGGSLLLGMVDTH